MTSSARLRALCAVALLIAFVLALAAPRLALAQEPGTQAVNTVITQNITANTTWTPAGSPYEVANDIIVDAGVTLTIQPGVTVRFAQNAGLRVFGTLTAVGTDANRILFTGSTAQKGWWEKISIEGTGGVVNTGSTLDYVTIEYGGASYGGLYLYYATATLAHATVRENAQDGVYGDSRGLAHISDATFTNNGSSTTNYAVRFNDGSMNPTLANLAATGNTNDAVALGNGALSGAHSWERMGLPYVILGDQLVSAGASLTVQPGVTVRFTQNAGLRAQGTLTAVGTAADPILFTGTTAQKGWWEKIAIEGTGAQPNTTSAIDYVTIEYGGASYGGLYLYYATVPVAHTTIRESGQDGFYGDSRGLAHISDSSFTNNGSGATNYAVRFNDGSMNPTLARLTVTGNSNDVIALGGGALDGVHTWEALGIPYLLLGDHTVAAAATLVIQPGVTVRFTENAGLRSFGTLTAVGTENSRILFTGSTAQKGWWEKIAIEGTGAAPNVTSALDYVTIEYGGASYGGLYLYYATVPISHVLIRQSEQDGLYADARGVPNISHSTFSDNGSSANHYALRFNDGSVNPTLVGLTLSGNQQDAIALNGGGMGGDHIWEAAGAPYVVIGDLSLYRGATLTIEAGVTVRFAEDTGLRLFGKIIAVGRADARILFTGTAPQKGWWEGLRLEGQGGLPNVGSMLDYVTIEYGGSSYANLYLYYASATVSHSILRQSEKDGLYADAGAGATVVESSQILDNTAYGLRNVEQNAPLMAANNWWGAASGPRVDANCNAGGTGSVLSLNVEYRPFLTAGNAQASSVAAPVAYTIAVAPQRWYIPADGVTRGEVILTLRDGEGNPIAGRTVDLSTSLGSVQSGSITDVHGQARARVYSTAPGTAQLTATIEEANPCISEARAGRAEVTFTAFNPDPLMADAAAPYMNNGLEFNPEPIVQGVRTTITARVTNPNNFPVKVNGYFGILQSNIGLSFPPVGSVEDFEIAPNSVGVITIEWTPPISGHYCIIFDYNWQGTGSAEAAAVFAGGRSQKNLNVYGPPPDNKNDKDILKKASDGMNMVKKVGKKAPGANAFFIPLQGVNALTEWQMSTAATISQQMGGDPPRQDYTTLAQAEPVLLDAVAAGNGITPQMAASLNTLRTALAWANAHGNAYLLSYDRYGGASNAGNLTWASQQMGAMVDHKFEMAKRLLDAADALEAYLAARQAAGFADIVLTEAEIAAYQAELEANGFSADEIAMARAVGLSDAQIQISLEQTLAADPAEQAGSMTAQMQQIIEDMRLMAGNILYPPVFGGSVGGSAGLLASGAGPTSEASVRADIPPMPVVPESNNLARVYEVVDTIQVGNPTGQTAQIDLSVRPVDLPAGWTATVTPVSVTVPAGAATSVEVRITPGGPAVQGSTATVAVEGHIGATLIGGVTMQVLVPKNPFKPADPVYLPVVTDK